jgi:hypothetical protein
MSQVSEDALLVLRTLGSMSQGPHDSQGGRYDLTGAELFQKTGLAPDRIDDAVDFLRHELAVDVERALGTAPFTFAYVRLTARGRHQYQELSSSPALDPRSSPTVATSPQASESAKPAPSAAEPLASEPKPSSTLRNEPTPTSSPSSPRWLLIAVGLVTIAGALFAAKEHIWPKPPAACQEHDRKDAKGDDGRAGALVCRGGEWKFLPFASSPPQPDSGTDAGLPVKVNASIPDAGCLVGTVRCQRGALILCGVDGLAVLRGCPSGRCRDESNCYNVPQKKAIVAPPKLPRSCEPLPGCKRLEKGTCACLECVKSFRYSAARKDETVARFTCPRMAQGPLSVRWAARTSAAQPFASTSSVPIWTDWGISGSAGEKSMTFAKDFGSQRTDYEAVLSGRIELFSGGNVTTAITLKRCTSAGDAACDGRGVLSIQLDTVEQMLDDLAPILK